MLSWLKFVYENPASLPIVILVGAGWILWWYGRFEWKKGKRGFRKFGLPVLGVGAAISLVAGPLATHLYLYRGLPSAFRASEIGILVAEVPGDKESEWQSKYARAIREQVDQNPQLRELIKVRLLERQLSSDPEEQQTEALAIGHRLRAAFILRPLTIEGVQEPWLTVVDEPYFSKLEFPVGKEFPNADLARLEELPLPSDVVLLSRCMLAISFHRQESYVKAGEQLRDILGAKQLPSMAPERSDLEVLYGDTFLATKGFAKAEAEYRKALVLKPKNAEAHNKLGIALGQEGQDNAAIAEFREAAELKPELSIAYINIGNVLAHKGKFDEAIAEYRKALALKSEGDDILEARFELSDALEHKGQHDEAIAELRKVLAISPREAGLHYDLGNILMQKGADREIQQGHAGKQAADRDFDAAIAEYRKALLLKPKRVLEGEIHINMGSALTFKGQLDDAIIELQTAVGLDSGIDESGVEVAHRDLGGIFVAKEQYEEAIKEFQKALAIEPNDPELRHNLGNALSEKGKYDEAIVQYRKALDLKPNDATIQKDLAGALQRGSSPGSAK